MSCTSADLDTTDDGRALPGHAFIFPVRLDDCEVPPIEIDDTRTLERIQHIDVFPEERRSAGLKKLLESLAAAPGHP